MEYSNILNISSLEDLINNYLNQFSTETLIEMLTILSDSAFQIKEKNNIHNHLIIIEPLTQSSIISLPFPKNLTKDFTIKFITEKIKDLIIKYNNKISHKKLLSEKENFINYIENLNIPLTLKKNITLQTNKLITKEYLIFTYIQELLQQKLSKICKQKNINLYHN